MQNVDDVRIDRHSESVLWEGRSQEGTNQKATGDGLADGDVEDIGERGVEENVAAHEHTSQVRMPNGTEQLDAIVQLIL
jgi:hypothetical protein